MAITQQRLSTHRQTIDPNTKKKVMGASHKSTGNKSKVQEREAILPSWMQKLKNIIPTLGVMTSDQQGSITKI